MMQAAYMDTLEELSWMDAASKEKAREKARQQQQHHHKFTLEMELYYVHCSTSGMPYWSLKRLLYYHTTVVLPVHYYNITCKQRGDDTVFL